MLKTSIIKIKTLSVLVLFICLGISNSAQLKVMTFKIRYDNPNDGDDTWNLRKTEVVNLLSYYSPEIVGIQEGLNHQVEYINQKLVNYKYVGVGRDDGKENGEYAAIFYDTNKFELLKTFTFWLSETPYKISVSWDASMERICTYGVLKCNDTKDTIHVFNCHYDHKGKLARVKSSELILSKISELGLSDKKVIVMGDLNVLPQSKPIQALTNVLEDGANTSTKAFYGPKGTFNSFDSCKSSNSRIDYIFTENLNVFSYRHIDDKRINGRCISDHLPVLIELYSEVIKSR